MANSEFINKQKCVYLATNDYEKINETITWCENNLGCRISAISFETLSKDNELFKKGWAVDVVSQDKSPPLLSFWFANDEDRMQFALIFS